MEDRSKITTIVIEDEQLIQERIVSLLKSDDDIKIVGIYGDGKSAIQQISQKKPKLIFLDIQLPHYNGFEILESISPQRMPEIVIVSAYSKYAITAFDYEVLDYVLKPFDKKRFYQAVDRVKKRIKQDDGYPRYLIAKSKGLSSMVFIAYIIWIESVANYVDIHLENKSYRMRATLFEMELLLNPAKFCRVHRSHIINIEKILDFHHLYQGDYRFQMCNGKILVSSKKYRKNVKSILQRK